MRLEQKFQNRQICFSMRRHQGIPLKCVHVHYSLHQELLNLNPNYPLFLIFQAKHAKRPKHIVK